MAPLPSLDGQAGSKFDKAMRFYQSGDLNEAQRLCLELLHANPRQPDTLHLLGLISHQTGRDEAAEKYLRNLVQIEPNLADAHYHLGLALRLQGRSVEATACWQRAVELKPDHGLAHFQLGNVLAAQNQMAAARECYEKALRFRLEQAEVHNNLGNVLRAQKEFGRAVDHYRRALRLKPEYGQARWNLAVVLHEQGQLDEAIECYQRLLRAGRQSPKVLNGLGNALRQLGQIERAIDCYRRAAQLQPGFAEAHFNLGLALFSSGKFAEAVSSYRNELKDKPFDARAHSSLGYALQCQGRLSEAIACYRRALELAPDLAEAHLNLGIALPGRLQHAQGLAHLRRAVELAPDSALIWNSYLHTLQYCPGISLPELLREHQKFEAELAAPLRANWRHHDNDRNPDRPLRLGFVSPHFDQHPVGYFLIRPLEHLEPSAAELFFYSDTRRKDATTARFQALATQSRDVAGQDDDALAQQIRSDRIDILFDLAGHCGGNRLLVFARRPAPIQITWMDYVGTTGLQAMDYILADAREVPTESDHCYAEKVLRLPDGYICYEPPINAPPVGPLPALARGGITFGSFNLLNKITTNTLEAWAKILRRLPTANLIIKYRGLEDEGTAACFRDAVTHLEIDPNRLRLEGWSPHAELLNDYRRIDIALDPIPYNGGLTTCEALWMGLPVVTCPGETFAARHGLSHLTNVGLTELIAANPDHYVDIAVALAEDLPRLAAMRTRLRQQVAESPLCDGQRFAQNLMRLLRQVWRQWLCG